MKNILLLVHDDEGQEARLQVALDLVRALNGHLVCLDVIQFPVLDGQYFVAAGQAPLLEDEREREARNRARLQARLQVEGIPWNMSKVTGEVARCVEDAAVLADLIVLNRKLEQSGASNMVKVASDVAMRSRRPVVAVAEACRRFDLRRPLIAWNGSGPAMAAMSAALPLLRLAQGVEIFEVEDGSKGSPATEAAAYLSRHGIHPTVRSVRDGLTDPAELIRAACADWGATYCVMGAFSHSPLREAIFGGVTRRMLAKSELPLFLAH